MSQLIENVYPIVESISTPGTLDGGDILMVGNHFYIGLSERTNLFGANQLIGILAKYGLVGSTIPVENFLHLKSGLSYLENNNLLVTRSFKKISEFQKYNLILVDENESYAANSLWINEKVLVPKGLPKLERNLNKQVTPQLKLMFLNSRKQDGGLSCLSLRY